MVIYVIVLLFSMFFATLAQNVRQEKYLKNTYKILAALSGAIFMAVSIFRYRVGTDWIIYEDYYYSINHGGDKFSEPLFNLLNRFLYLFSEDVWLLIAVVAVLIGVFTFFAIYEQSISAPLSILIFFVSGDFFNSQNQLRQMLATAIMLYALKYIYDRKIWRFLLFALLAGGIHVSAFLFVPIYFLYGVKVNIRKQIVAYVIVFLSAPLIGRLVEWLVAKTRYGWYFDSIYNMSNFYLIGFVFTIFFLAIFYYYCAYDKTEDKKYNLYVNMYYIAALTIAFSSVIPQMDRITKLFASITFLAVPRLIIREKDRNRRIVLYLIVVGAFVVKLLYDVYVNRWYGAIPYDSVFTHLFK